MYICVYLYHQHRKLGTEEGAGEGAGVLPLGSACVPLALPACLRGGARQRSRARAAAYLGLTLPYSDVRVRLPDSRNAATSGN